MEGHRIQIWQYILLTKLDRLYVCHIFIFLFWSLYNRIENKMPFKKNQTGFKFNVLILKSINYQVNRKDRCFLIKCRLQKNIKSTEFERMRSQQIN